MGGLLEGVLSATQERLQAKADAADLSARLREGKQLAEEPGRTRIPGSQRVKPPLARASWLRGIRPGLLNHPLMNLALNLAYAYNTQNANAGYIIPGWRYNGACPPTLNANPAFGEWRGANGFAACLQGQFSSGLASMNTPITLAAHPGGFKIFWLYGPQGATQKGDSVSKWMPEGATNVGVRAGVRLLPIVRGGPNPWVDPLVGGHPIGAWRNVAPAPAVSVSNARVWNPDRIEQSESGPQRVGRQPENQQAYDRAVDRALQPSAQPQLRPQPQPWPYPIHVDGHDRKPWPRQRKIGFRWRAAYQLAGKATELLDAVDCAFDSLPKKVRAPIIRAHRKYGRPVSMKAKMAALARHGGQMDLERLGKCILIEGLMDNLYAAGGKAGVQLSGAHGVRPSSLQQTQQGEGTDYGSQNPIKEALELLYQPAPRK